MNSLRLFLLTLIMFSCASKKVQSPDSVHLHEECVVEEGQQQRAISALSKRCSDLFQQQKGIDLFDPAEKIVDEFAPGAITESFWKLVGQLALNSNSKILLETDRFSLTQVSTQGTKVNVTYIYDPPSNQFVVETIKYTKNGTATDLTLNTSGEYTEAELNALIRSKVPDLDPAANFKKAVSYKVYEKVKHELNNLNLFTTHELLKISKMDRQGRLTKYSAILHARKLKNYLTEALLQDFLYKPVRAFVISIASIYLITSQVNVAQQLGLAKEEVPAWVAPSVVNMTARQDTAAQKEAVLLMKLINANKSKQPREEDFKKIKAKPIKINETDFYTVKKGKNGKTYFILTHENENGSLDVFFQEIDPLKFQNLARTAIK